MQMSEVLSHTILIWKIQATLRSNGVLIAEVVPEGGRISGQSSVVQLDAWNWEDAAIRQDNAIHLRWPNISPKLTAGENPPTPKQDPIRFNATSLTIFNAAKSILARSHTIMKSTSGMRL